MGYWEERQEQKVLASEKKITEYYSQLEGAFEQSKREIQAVIADFVTRYAIENDTPGGYATALRKLNKVELGELQDYIDLVNEHLGEYNQSVRNLSYKARATRYQALETQIDGVLQQLYAIQYEHKGKETFRNVYADAYYRTWFNVDQYTGFHKEFANISPRKVNELISYPFNGANYSDRLWKQKDSLKQQLTESLTTMLIQGKHPKTLSKDFAKKFKVKEFEARRLLLTEGAYITEQATKTLYEESEVEKYEILATLDNRTSEICRKQDGKVYELDKAVVGVNYPPFHMFCRTTTVPYFPDDTGTRIARDPDTDRQYEVPENMTYQKWYKEYVKGEK